MPMPNKWILLTGIAVLLTGLLLGATAGGVELEDPPSLTPAEREAEQLLGNLDSAVMLQGSVRLLAPELEQEVQGIVTRLAAAARLDCKTLVHLLNTPITNAWAIPNGDILVTSGLLTLVDNTDELAVILGHEIGHLQQHDSYIRISHQVSSQKANLYIGSLVGAALAGAGSAAASTGVGYIPIPDQALRILFDQLAARVASDMVGKFLTDATSTAARAILLHHLSGYDQAQELRADRIGLRLAGLAGFDPARGNQVFRKMAALKDRLAQERPEGRQP